MRPLFAVAWALVLGACAPAPEVIYRPPIRASLTVPTRAPSRRVSGLPVSDCGDTRGVTPVQIWFAPARQQAEGTSHS